MRIHHPKHTRPLSAKLFWVFLVISELRSRIYIDKSAIFDFLVFLWIFLHEVDTLYAIDIDNIGCLKPFLPHWEHFWNRVSMQLNCTPDLTPRHRFLHFDDVNYLLSEQAPNVFPCDNMIIRRRKIFGVRRKKETWDGKGRTLLKKEDKKTTREYILLTILTIHHMYVWRVSSPCNMILGCCAIKTTVLSSLVSRLTPQHCRNTSESLRIANCK